MDKGQWVPDTRQCMYHEYKIIENREEMFWDRTKEPKLISAKNDGVEVPASWMI